MRVAIIEDEPDCSENYRFFLERRGHLVEVYDDADEAVDKLERIARSDVIILDLMLQLGTKIGTDEASETGIALYLRIRKISKDVPIAVVTARSQSEVWAAFERDPRARYVGKPIASLSTLFEAVEAWS